MPITTTTNELHEVALLDDDSSDEEEDEESDQSGSDEEDDDSESGSDDDDDDDSDDDSEDDDDSDDDSGSGSDSDGSSSSNKKKKSKKKKNANNDEEEKKEEEDDSNTSTIYKIQQISTKLSWLLDDLHRTFKPKSVPKIDPQSVFPYSYTAVPQLSPQSNPFRHHDEISHDQDTRKPPISSPIRHGNAVDRGAGGNYIFPSYAAPPSKHDIKKLYAHYSDQERRQIAENQHEEQERKSLFSRSRRPQSARNSWENRSFSDRFISGSNSQRHENRNSHSNSKRKLFSSSCSALPIGQDRLADNRLAVHTFDELYRHYDEQKRLMAQKHHRTQRMKKKLYWFRKHNHEDRERNNDSDRAKAQNVRLSEKKPFIAGRSKKDEKQELYASQSLKESEQNLLNKAAQILLGNERKSGGDEKRAAYADVVGADSPDSLQEKILQIASDEEQEEENRLPTFV